MVRETLSRLQNELKSLLVVDVPCIDNRLRAAFDADLLLCDLDSHGVTQAVRIEAVMNTVQLLGRNSHLEILGARISGVADVGEQACIAEDGVNPATQGWYLVGPGPIVIEDDSLPEQQRDPGDPQIPRVHEVRFPKNAPKRQTYTTAEVSQHRWAKRRESPNDGHARRGGNSRAVGRVRRRDVQPGLGGERCQVLGCRYEYLSICLGIGKRIFESK